MNKLLSRFCAALVILLATLPVRPAGAESLVPLRGHVSPLTLHAAKLDRVPAEEMVSLSFVVSLDQALLDQTLDSLYGQQASPHKHFLSTSEFAQKFGLAEKRQAIKSFATAQGLTIDSTEDDPTSMVVKVSGPASAIEKTFSIRLNHYRDSHGRTFRAEDTDPLIPASLAAHLGAVLGLTNLSGLFHPHLRFRPKDSTSSPRFSGSGPSGSLIPSDIQAIYGLNQVSLKGTGQNVALFELDGYNPSDVTLYKNTFGYSTPVNFIGVDGTVNLCGVSQTSPCNSTTMMSDNGMIEVALDIDMVLALASGVSQIAVYAGPNTGLGIYDTYDKIATDNTCKIISTSWGLDEQDSGSSFVTAESQIFQKMALQGQSVYAASGDNGAFDAASSPSSLCNGTTDLCVDDPASQPYVTGVGGTSLSGTVQSFTETTWNTLGSSNGGASGGGVSVIWSLPSYQVGTSGLSSQQFRNVPDVALNADPASGYAVAVGGGFLTGVGGTSAAAPLWAAFTALINQENVTAGNSVLGFANPFLYQLAAGSTYNTLYGDITSGNNGHFNAGIGYDNSTGLGSFKGSAMITAVTGVLNLLSLESLSNVYAYPNPWDTRKDTHRQVTIANVPDDATIKIFTLSGFWVRNLAASSGRAVWDLTNDHGERVASGLYFYLVTTPTAKTKGEIAIIK